MISRLRTNLQSPPLVLLQAMHKVNTYHFDMRVAKPDDIKKTVAASGCGKVKKTAETCGSGDAGP